MVDCLRSWHLVWAVAVVGGLALVGSTAAQTLTWTADVDFNWDTSTENWIDGDDDPVAFATNDNVVFTSSGAGTVVIDAGGIAAGAVNFTTGGPYAYTFTGGGLTTGIVTLAANANATIEIDTGTWARNGITYINNNHLVLTDTAVTGNHNIEISSAGTFTYDGGAASSTFARFNGLTGEMNVDSGSIHFSNNILVRSGGVINVNGGTLSTSQLGYDVNTGGAPMIFNLIEGVFESNSTFVLQSGLFDNTPDPMDRPVHQFNLHDGSATIATTFRLGGFRGNNTIDRATEMSAGGQLNMSGGQLMIHGDAMLGFAAFFTGNAQNPPPDPNVVFGSDGRWNQTGGVATVGGEMIFQQIVSGDQDIDRSVLQFVVGENALLTFTGAGMAISELGSGWLLTADRYNTAGTIRFSPGSAITQNLLVFGEEIGTSNTNMASLIATNYGIGTLDLRVLVAQNATLNLLDADNFATNALYVDSLLMDSPVNPGAFFEGDINVYYNPATSDITGTWAFGSGTGQLIMIPEPGTMLLMAAGGLLLMSRSRRRDSHVHA